MPSATEEIISPNRYAIRKTFAELILREIIPNRSSFYRSHGMRGYPTTAPRHEPYWQVKIARGGDLVLPADIDYYQVTDMVSLARFMIHCGEQQHFGAFNVAYPPTRFRDFIQTIVDATQSKVKLHWIPQQFLLDNDVRLMREQPAGRYHFNVDRALAAGLQNRPFTELLKDQLKGYADRNPKDDFKFGQAKTSTISTEREAEIIQLWEEYQSRT